MSYRSTIQHFVKHAACKRCIRNGWLLWSNSMFPQSFLRWFFFFFYFYTKEVWTLLLLVLMVKNNSTLMVSSRNHFIFKRAITVILEMYVTMHSITTTIYMWLTTCNKMCLYISACFMAWSCFRSVRQLLVGNLDWMTQSGLGVSLVFSSEK